MSDISKAVVKARSDLDSVLEGVRDEEKERDRVVKSISDTENIIKSKSEVGQIPRQIREPHFSEPLLDPNRYPL